MSPLFNTTPMSLSNPNNPLARLQETANDPTSNPFDVKIRKPAFKGTRHASLRAEKPSRILTADAHVSF